VETTVRDSFAARLATSEMLEGRVMRSELEEGAGISAVLLLGIVLNRLVALAMLDAHEVPDAMVAALAAARAHEMSVPAKMRKPWRAAIIVLEELHRTATRGPGDTSIN
jgi:hypothetical protein